MSITFIPVGLKLRPRKVKTCDTCNSQEGKHYCLLWSKVIKNMDIKGCQDWEEKQ